MCPQYFTSMRISTFAECYEFILCYFANKFLLPFFMQHNIKKLRNNVEKSSSHGGKRILTKGGKNIYWSHWKEAYNWDQSSNSCPIHERLKEDHFDLTPSSRMRNGWPRMF
jgi:hypothetical protein